MRLIVLILLLFALPAWATDTALVDRDGVTTSMVLRSASDEVYAAEYGALTSASINAAITAIGSSTKTLVLTPGDWAMSEDITVPPNVTLKVQQGAKIVKSSGTLTVNGPLNAPQSTWLSGFTGGLTFGTVKELYTDWTDAAGDGVTADQATLGALLASANYANVHFNGSKTYYLASTLYALSRKGVKLHGHGATLKHSGVETSALQVGWPYQTYTGQAITVTKNSNTFTIPGGVTFAVGDMVNLSASGSYIPGYSYGMLATITAISGSTATFDILPVYDFTAANLTVYKQADDVEVEGFNFDNSGSTQNSGGVVIYGRNVNVHDNRAIGNDTAGIAYNVNGINVTLERNFARGYVSKNTGAGVARYGDGIAAAGYNISIRNNTIYDCKHAISLARRDMITNAVTIKVNTLVQSPARYGETFVQTGTGTMTTYSGVMDIHGNAENVVIEDNEIDGAGIAGLTIRNGKAVVRNNRIRFWNTASTRGIFMIGETTLQSLVLAGNDIWAMTASTPLMTAADGSYLDNIAVASPVYAQGVDVNVKQDGTNTLTNVTATGAFPTLAGTAPSTPCQNNQLWVDSDAPSGQRIYACESGTWVLQGVSSGMSNPMSASGDIIYGGVSGTPSRLAKSTDGKVLTLLSGLPAWADPTSGAPVGTSYITLGADATLTNERVLTGTANQITVTDGGAGGAVTLSLPQSINTGAVTRFAGLNINGALGAGSGEVKLYGTSPLLWLQNSTQGQTSIQDAAASLAILKTSATGPSTIDIAPLVTDGTSAASFRFFRTTNTSGAVGFDIFNGNTLTGGVQQINSHFDGKSDSYVQVQGGNFGIGKNNPSVKLDVNGEAKATTFTGTIPAATTYGATTTVDLSLGDSPSVTLAGNTTLAFSNPKAGQWHRLNISQPSAGGTYNYTVTWPSTGLVCTWRNTASNAAPTLLTGANKVDTIIIHTLSTSSAECWTAGNK